MGNESINKNIDKFLKLKLYFFSLTSTWLVHISNSNFSKRFSISQFSFCMHLYLVILWEIQKKGYLLQLDCSIFFLWCQLWYSFLWKKKINESYDPKKEAFFNLAPDKSSDWFRWQYFSSWVLTGWSWDFSNFFLT